jgi:Fe-S oxidoreductase
MQENTNKLRSTWLEMGKPTFILACSSCCGIFEKYLSDIPFISLWEIIAQYGVPDSVKKGNGKILNIHDACSTRHNQKVQDSLRSIVAQLGYQIEELKYSKEKTKCCGYGGLVYYANREQSDEFVRDRISESKDDLLVYCAMCKDLFVGGGKRTYHILDLLFAEDLEKAACRQMPNLSQRHENRAQLKRNMLKEFWNEEPGEGTKQMNNLIIPDHIFRIMEQRYILREDVEKVINHAQESGERFYNPEDGSYLANLRVENVTFWVHYFEKDGTIQVSSVYSHRMEVVNE